jgi:hypothetical protein
MKRLLCRYEGFISWAATLKEAEDKGGEGKSGGGKEAEAEDRGSYEGKRKDSLKRDEFIEVRPR